MSTSLIFRWPSPSPCEKAVERAFCFSVFFILTSHGHAQHTYITAKLPAIIFLPRYTQPRSTHRRSLYGLCHLCTILVICWTAPLLYITRLMCGWGKITAGWCLGFSLSYLTLLWCKQLAVVLLSASAQLYRTDLKERSRDIPSRRRCRLLSSRRSPLFFSIQLL